MKTKAVNRKVIALLREISDDKQVWTIQKSHIKVVGNYGGQERSFTLCSSPTNRNYLKSIRSSLKRFLQSLNIQKKFEYPLI